LTEQTIHVEFTDNRLIPTLFGIDDSNLRKLENYLQIRMAARGGMLSITGKDPEIYFAKDALESYYISLKKGGAMRDNPVDMLLQTEHAKHPHLRAVSPEAGHWQQSEIVLRTPKKAIFPRTRNQVLYMQQLQTHDLVFAAGPAGTGKTYIAVAQAVALWLEHKIERIVLSRPALEAGEKIGFLPGDFKEKLDPYLRPLYDALYDMVPAELLQKALTQNMIEIAPLGFMRGRTLTHSYIIVDEAQNTTASQMKMLLTRLGEGSRMVVTGEPTQTDLPASMTSGLQDALDRLKKIEQIGFVSLTESDVIRHPLTKQIIKAYHHA